MSVRVPYCLLFLALIAGCAADSGTETAPEATGDTAQTSALVENSPAFTIEYGRHYPNGAAAVEYLLGPDGTWKKMDPLHYTWNYYPECATDGHPYDRTALISAADGTRYFTAPDANCNLLLDDNHDGVLDSEVAGFAFHEHNGLGIGGQRLTNPFTNFWFDDNWLARYVTRVYGREAPHGLSDGPDAKRWQVIGGDTRNWQPYGDQFFDRMALDGLYYVAQGDLQLAIEKWDAILGLSGAHFDETSRRFVYPNIDGNYHFGLFSILTTVLLDHPTSAEERRRQLLQHWISLRSHILSNQERDGSTLLGWRTSISDTGSLMNTETIAANVLALGAGAIDVFEAGREPLGSEPRGYYLTASNVMSAVVGDSETGYMTLGPGKSYNRGAYEVQLVMRAGPAQASVGSVDVYDRENDRVLASTDVDSTAVGTEQEWSRVMLNFELPDENNALEFRFYWRGVVNTDIAAVRIRKRT